MCNGNGLFSVVVPVYQSEAFVDLLVDSFNAIHASARERFGLSVEFVFVVDGSRDASHRLLVEALPSAKFPSQVIEHSRNFGSFAAIRTGLRAGRGKFLAVIAADLQEPPELLLDFLDCLASDKADVVVGRREGRDDPTMTKIGAGLFWRLYRALVIRELPPGGVDVFGCKAVVRDEPVKLEEAHSSLVGQLFWIGFRRAEIPYRRRARAFGRSAWTFRKKLQYLLDSVFAFTDLPIRILLIAGGFGLMISVLIGGSVFVLRLLGLIYVPGYSATMLMVLFFGALNTFGLGVVGSYAARAYENTKRRPIALVRSAVSFAGACTPEADRQ